MAQKSHPRGIRENYLYRLTNQYAVLKNRTGHETQMQLCINTILHRFYENHGYMISFSESRRDYQNLVLTFQLIERSPKISLGAKSIESVFDLPVLTERQRKDVTSSKDVSGLISFYNNSKFLYHWSSEKHILSREIYHITGFYPFLIKTNIFTNCLYTSGVFDANQVVCYIKDQLEKASAKRQPIHLKAYLDKVVQSVTECYSIKGVRIQLKGRLPASGSGGKAGRAKKEVSSYGNVPLQSLRSYIDYGQNHVYTKMGLCGARVWLNHRILFPKK